jgi:hypothetical protein
LFRIGNCTNKKIDPVPVPTCVNATINLGDNILGDTTSITVVDTVRNTTNHSSCDFFNGLGIWYKINPFTNSANLTASTCFNATDFDTVMTVYEGDNCRPQVCVAQNDDEDAVSDDIICSTVRFVASSTTYWIFVDGYGPGDQGIFQLTVIDTSG